MSNFSDLMNLKQQLSVAANDVLDTMNKNNKLIDVLNMFQYSSEVALERGLDLTLLRTSDEADPAIIFTGATRVNDDGSVIHFTPTWSSWDNKTVFVHSYPSVSFDENNIPTATIDDLAILRDMLSDDLFALDYPFDVRDDDTEQSILDRFNEEYGVQLPTAWAMCTGHAGNRAARLATRTGVPYTYTNLRTGKSGVFGWVCQWRRRDQSIWIRFYPNNDDSGILDVEHEIADSAACQSVLSSALHAVESGQTSMADIASLFGMTYTTSSAKAKQLAQQLVNSTSQSSSTLVVGLLSAYKGMAGYSVETDGTLKWDDIAVPSYDGAIGTVISHAIQSGVQIAATIGLMVGGVVLKVISGLTLAVSYIASRVQTAAAQAAGTTPRLKDDTTDALLKFPLIQETDIPIAYLPDEAQEMVRSVGTAKIISPFYTAYFYNFNQALGQVSCKMFLSIQSDASVDSHYFPILSPQAVWPNSQVPTFIIDIANSKGILYTPSFVKQIFDLQVFESPCYTPMMHVEPTGFNVGSSDARDYVRLWSAILTAATTLYWSAYLTTKTIQGSANLEWYLDLASFNTDTSVTAIRELWTLNRGVHGFFSVMAAKLFGAATINQGVTGQLYSWHSNANQFIALNSSKVSDADISTIINDVLPALSDALSADLLPGVFKGSHCYVVPFTVTPEDYAVTLPQRSYAALVWGEVLGAVVIAALFVGGKIFKTVMSRKFQPKVNRNIAHFERWRDDIKSMTKRDGESYANFIKRQDVAWKALNKAVRKSNLWTGLLGMGTFDVGAGFWDGPTTIGGNWSSVKELETSTDTDNATDSSVRALLADGEGEIVTLQDLLDVIVGR